MERTTQKGTMSKRGLPRGYVSVNPPPHGENNTKRDNVQERTTQSVHTRQSSPTWREQHKKGQCPGEDYPEGTYSSILPHMERATQRDNVQERTTQHTIMCTHSTLLAVPGKQVYKYSHVLYKQYDVITQYITSCYYNTLETSALPPSIMNVGAHT